MASRITLLQGRPGAGKTMMSCLTAVRKPVYVMDIDRKLAGHEWAAKPIASGALRVWELAETLDEVNLNSRIKQLTENTAANVAPQGWKKFADHYNTLSTNKDAMESGTWVVDSATRLGDHFQTHISFLAKKNKLTFDQWMTYLKGWHATMSVLVDLAMKHDKDLIVTVHEKDRETAGDETTGVKYEYVKSGEGVAKQRVLQGTMDIQIVPTIDGSFAGVMASYFQEVYHLYVKESTSETAMPEWKCRVVPDGKRALRTSFPVKQPVFKPDFKEIWK